MLNPATNQNMEPMENAEEKHSMPNSEEMKEQADPRWKVDHGEDNSSEIEGLDEEEESTEPISDQDDIRMIPADRGLFHLKRWHDTGKLIVPPWQRKDSVWNQAQASKLIESFLLKIPVPVVYLSKTKDGKYEVIDGLQRLTSVFKFFNNEYKLTHLNQLTHLRGKKFKDLDEGLQGNLEDVTLRTFELSSDTNPNMRFIIFERLNTGGTKLNDMEIRNCIFRGKLNDLITELADSENFRLCHGLTEKSTKRMQDRFLVLRFLAFYEKTHLKYKEPLKKFLNEFQDTYRDANEIKLDEYRQKFEHCMKASRTVFGKYAFRLKEGLTKVEDKRQLSKSQGEWSQKSNVAIFQGVATSFARYGLGQITRAADRICEEYLDLVTMDKQWIDCVQLAAHTAPKVTYVFETWQKRLAEVMQDVPPNDGRRTFSKQLKKEMFEQDKTCSLCGQEIKMLDDAALDHDKHYWRGGATIPENARLAHRFCNQSRGGR